MKVTKVRRIVLEEAVPVYDLSVHQFHNFKLADGCFVHNSKDVTDSLAGMIHGLSIQKAVWLQHGISWQKPVAHK